MPKPKSLADYTAQDIIDTLDGDETTGLGLAGGVDVTRSVYVNGNVLTVSLDARDGSHTHARFKLTPMS